MPSASRTDSAAGPPRGRPWATALACVLAGLGFGAVVWLRRGPEPAQQYLAAYLIELSLSVDNVFVFALVFDQFAVAPARQGKLLFWGIAGAIILRSALLLAGLGAISRFAWVIPVFGAFILVTGLRLAFTRKAFNPSESRLLRFVTRRAPAALVALLVLETADLVFALDSLPAVIAVTHDAAIAIASNLFAILGLRSLYFIVSGAMARLRFLKLGLAAILSLVGVKMLAEPWYPVPTLVSLVAIAAILSLSVGASLLAAKREG
jgi:tellurite resistance protein TerC